MPTTSARKSTAPEQRPGALTNEERLGQEILGLGGLNPRAITPAGPVEGPRSSQATKKRPRLWTMGSGRKRRSNVPWLTFRSGPTGAPSAANCRA